MKPRDQHKTAQIFAATLLLVRENGLSGITMSEIAKAAKIATGTLYIYFENKETLINELFTECRKSSVAIYFEGYHAEMPFKEGFRIVWNNLLQFRIDHFEKAVFMDQCYHSPFITETTKELTKKMIHPLFKLVETGKAIKALKELDNLMLLTYMVGGINEYVKRSKYSAKKITKQDAMHLFNLCWDGIKA